MKRKKTSKPAAARFAAPEIQHIEQLLQFMTEHNLEEFEYSRGDLRIRLRKPSAGVVLSSSRSGYLPEIIVAGGASEVSGGAQETDGGLLGFEVGVEDGNELFALCDAGGLLVLGGHLRAGEVAAAGLQLDEHDVELLLSKLPIERGDLGARGELGRGVAGAEPAIKELIADRT